MKIDMNKVRHSLHFFGLVPALLLFSFLIGGCADSPTEVRNDNRMRTYISSSASEKVTTSTTGEKQGVTAHYILRPGHRPDFAPKEQIARTQPQTYQEPPPAPKLEDLQMVLEVSDVLFDFDKWVIRASVVPELDKWAAYFQNNPQVTADIYGHADSTGPSSYNQNLSVKRAQAVINYLAQKGVNPKRFTAKGFGEEQPTAPNTTKEGRQKNRRVELNL